MSQIDAATNSKIRTLCSQGGKLHKLGDYDRAVSKYYEALTLLPRGEEHGNIGAYLHTCIGEAYWSMRSFENAGESFCEAYECTGMNENAQIAMRIGQCLVECGDLENARGYLKLAVRLGGESLLLQEDHKYYEVLHPENRPKPQAEPVGRFDGFEEASIEDIKSEGDSLPVHEKKPESREKAVRPAAAAAGGGRFDAGLRREQSSSFTLSADVKPQEDDEPFAPSAPTAALGVEKPAPADEPEQKKPGLFDRIFRKKK